MTSLLRLGSATAEALGELAPTGTLRVAINIGNAATVRLEDDGCLSGPAPDMADALALCTGLPVTLLRYESAAAVIAADQGAGAWDVAFLAADPARTDSYHFTAPYLTIEATLAVRAASGIDRFDQADLPGITIGSVTGAAYDSALGQCLRQASRVAFDSPHASSRAFADGEVDAVAGVRQSLTAALTDLPDVHVLKEPFAVIPHAMAVPVARKRAADLLDAVMRTRDLAAASVVGEGI